MVNVEDISVVIPTYNRCDLLKRAMNSDYKVLIITADIPASSRRERLRLAGVSVPPKINLRTLYHNKWRQ